MEYIILWIFALFGLWNIISRVVENLYMKSNNIDFEVVLKVKNEDIAVEHIIKELEQNNFVDRIVVMDMNSGNQTSQFLHKLDGKYSKVYFIKN